MTDFTIEYVTRRLLLLTAFITFLVFSFICNAFAEESFVKEEYVEISKNITLRCQSNNNNVTWMYDNQPLKNERLTFSYQNNRLEVDNKGGIGFHNTSKTFVNTLTIRDVRISDAGNYSCEHDSTHSSSKYVLNVFSTPKIVQSSNSTIKQKIKHGVVLYCIFELFPQNETVNNNLKWLKDSASFTVPDKYASILQLNATHINYTLEFTEVYKKENGSYECVLYNADGIEIIKNEIVLLVLDVPQVSIDYAKAVGSNRIFLNWTINDGNDPIQKFFIQYAKEDSSTFTYYKDSIGGKNTSYILDTFQANTTYILRISAKNSIGSGVTYQYPISIHTLDDDPIFIPKVETTGSTSSTITIGWSPPPQYLLEYIQYYELIVSESGEVPKLIEETIYQQNSRNLPYMFDNLKTATEYEFKVRACSDLTKICGPWSELVNGTTMDGVATKPTELQVNCVHQNFSRFNSIAVSWSTPKTPNGKVVSYLISLEGTYSYSVNNKIHVEKWGPKIRRVDEPHHKTIYEGVSPNTNYSVTIAAITRHKKTGEPAEGKCSMPISVPEVVGRIMWSKVESASNKYVLKLYMPKISERNGRICCYRLYLVRMMSGNTELPSPEELPISTYQEVHNSNNTSGGAYIAEMISGNFFKSEIFLGDGFRYNENKETIAYNDNICRICLEGIPFLRRWTNDTLLKKRSQKNFPSSEISQREQLTPTRNLSQDMLKVLEHKRRERRNPIPITDGKNETQLETLNRTLIDVFDGEIDINSNYTGFLEVIVRNKDTVLTAYSDYFDVITPGTEPEQIRSVDDITVFLNIIIEALAILIGIVLVVLIVLCFLHHYNTKNTIPGDETYTLRDSLRALFGRHSNNHSRFLNSSNNKGFDVGPIHKADLINAYKTRHKDTDYGFLREYEMLPNRFSDRTTKNSDIKDNASKNRYPDIKAYDQTRVKLSPINGVNSTDYINANFVIGYKERKKFICAQGPMESTIDEFWRMIWEQHLEIIVMLTNLEEYNKSKCAKYWPEKVLDSRQFGDITVKFVSEKRTGDYLIRLLDIFKTNLIGEDEEHRQITQYHYLTWKDFMAPEHPHGIIKFIRQINAVYSLQRGPILVHCSAGVGRTGTLVALDSLIQQLEEEEIVSIFNTVCDLRHQRNFLVQSLKQYIFLYRALLDTAIFGNTELKVNTLSTAIENLKLKPNDGKDKCKLELEFEKLLSFTDEISKSCCVGESEENRIKNRSDEIVPYDRNRVILSPIPLKDNSTYINASFVEGYDNSDTFIITQDPLDHTIGDFWRMISEQSITTLIMISEIGDGQRKCPRYWADDEIQYEHILVKYVQSENCPYYTRREFHVTNCKIDDTLKVTQFQYNGWPTVDGEVPEVCRGVIELVDQAFNHYSSRKNGGCRSPVTVHCSLGTDRSSIFVAMSILVQHLRFEKGVDICSTTRKLRSQRLGLINTYAQYEFLHRAILNYSDLHNLSETSD